MRPQTIVERLDFISKRISGLKFTPPTQLKPGDDQGYGCFMSCDMFYIEIKVDQSHQSVKDVIISHGNNADGISCPVLRKVLADQDFETFAKHLAGLHSIYQITTNDKKVKQRAYPALTALETDLTILYDHQRRRTNNCHDLVHKSPLGIMEPRKGGLPVRLTYFITAYDSVDITQKRMINLTISNIIDKNLGLSATVEIEGSSHNHKLQVKSLISTQHNSSLPAYAPFNSQNSEKLPAQFVLKLSQPLPMLITSINQIINEVNEPTTIREYLINLTANSKESLISLIARQELDLNKGPFCRSLDALKGNDGDSGELKKHVYSVKLLDQYHTYHILDNYLERQEGVYVNKIPFTHPTSIPNILRVLRQQALFNFLIGSCIRRNKNISNNIAPNGGVNGITLDDSSEKSSELNIFDVIPVTQNNICISFEHPSKESLATLEIDLKEMSCQLYALDRESVCSNEFATKVLQKCWSIPITLRSVLKKCNERRLTLLEDANKRRERELQELLTNNSTQQSLQFKPHLQAYPTSKNLDSSKGSPVGAKSKARTSIDQFAIKQRSPRGLKLTVTKTKPIIVPSSSSSSSSSSTTKTTTATNSSIITNSLSSSIGAATSSNKQDANKILGLGSTTTNIKYKIPKISKTQQASQSGTNNQANSSDLPNNSNNNDNPQSQVEDSSNNPSSSAISSLAPSSTTDKRTTATPFNRTNSSNRNPVSSSTHPLGRTTSNPLANANSRPSSTSTTDNHALNRISSSNQTQQNMRLQLNNRIGGLQPPLQRAINPNLVGVQPSHQVLNQPMNNQPPVFVTMPAFVSDSIQRPSPSMISTPPQFYVRQPMFEDASNNAVSSTPQRTNNEASQSALSDRKTTESIGTPTIPQILSGMLGFQSRGSTNPSVVAGSSKETLTSTQTANLVTGAVVGPGQSVSSSSDSGSQDKAQTISTPSSPTECGQAETVPPPPLIPIDSLDEPQATTSSENDHPDDASDRLSIVDPNENIIDSNSVAG